MPVARCQNFFVSISFLPLIHSLPIARPSADFFRCFPSHHLHNTNNHRADTITKTKSKLLEMIPF
jgi:hypothetical protein